jgi:hypothetical protein
MGANSYRGAVHAWLGTLAYSSAEGLGATLTPAECKELHGLLMLLDGPEQNAAPQSEGTRDAGLPDAGCSEPADAALSSGRPAADAAPHHMNQEPQDFAAALALLKLAREEVVRLRGPNSEPALTAWISAGEQWRMQDLSVTYSCTAYNRPLRETDVPLYTLHDATGTAVTNDGTCPKCEVKYRCPICDAPSIATGGGKS